MLQKTIMNRRTLGWLLKIIGKSKYGILGITLCRALVSAGAVLSALVIRSLVDGAVAGDKNRFLFYLIMCGAVFLFEDILCAIAYYLEEITGFHIEKRLKSHLYHHLLNAEYRNLEKWHTGELMNHLNGDVGIIASNMLSFLPGLASVFINLFGAIVILSLWDWRFCAVFLFGGTVVLSASVLVRKIMKQFHRDVREQYDHVQSFQQETIENILMVRSFGAENRAKKNLHTLLDRLKSVRIRKNIFSNFCYGGMELLMDVGYLLGLAWCGFGILKGNVSFGTAVAALQLVGLLRQPLSDISACLPRYYALCASAERLREIERLPMEEKGNPLDGKVYGQKLSAIHAENITFSYERTQILENASLSVKKGEFVAFGGKSGIGKSTLLKLLLAFYTPDKGRVYFTDTTGDRLSVTPAARNLFAYVPQGNFLMSGTIYEAVDFLHTSSVFSEKEKAGIREACKAACADAFIQEMPLKYETVIGEHGTGLSEGQMQRLAIARALYTDAPVLLLDEATSALDETTEWQVLKNIRAMKDKTVLIVTHKNMALSFCDRLIRIADKKFIEECKDE